eukprot:5201230-Pyramimonas_sp.AAC.1
MGCAAFLRRQSPPPNFTGQPRPATSKKGGTSLHRAERENNTTHREVWESRPGSLRRFGAEIVWIGG